MTAVLTKRENRGIDAERRWPCEDRPRTGQGTSRGCWLVATRAERVKVSLIFWRERGAGAL